MKTKIYVIAVCLMFAACASRQNTQSGKADIKTAKVENAIQSSRYEVNVNIVNPMNGQVRHLTSHYSVRISGDSTYVSLPYFGRAYSAPYGGEGGINITNLIYDYNVNYKKGKSYSIDFKAPGANDIYRFSMDISTSGKASIRVTCNNRQAISYLGELILPEE
jgi:hypothetical protein